MIYRDHIILISPTPTPYVAALAPHALKAPLTCTLASGYTRLMELWYKQMSTALIVWLHM